MLTQNNPIYRLFPGMALVPFKPGSRAIGYAEKTARNLLTWNKYPIKTVLVGRKRFIPIDALASYYAELVGMEQQQDSTPPPEPQKRGRGRPRKCEQEQGGAK